MKEKLPMGNFSFILILFFEEINDEKRTSLFTEKCTSLFTEKCTFLFTENCTLLFTDYKYTPSITQHISMQKQSLFFSNNSENIMGIYL